jgi:uncharacterized membrane-anchored protein YitT (DUF2179 family)
VKKNYIEYLLVILGVVLVSFGFDSFLIPNKIAAGGVSGIATIIYHLTAFPVGMSMLIINIPLFIIGAKIAGRHFFIKTLMATVLLSFLIDFVDMPVVTQDITLATVYGGVIVGSGLGLVIYSGATTGGTDMAAKILHQMIPRVSIATFLFIIDLCVVICAAIVFDTHTALYAVATIYIFSKMIELIVQGFKSGKAYLVITDKCEVIKEKIITDLDRGVTIINAVGGYSNESKSILLCVLRRNTEVIKLKNIVKNSDKSAFMIASNVTEVLGEGFGEH